MRSSSNSKKWFDGLFAALAVLILAFSCTSARAQLLFNNGSADLGTSSLGADGFFADTGNSAAYESGDVFTPTASGTAQSISFAGFYFNGGTPTAKPADNFTISLYSVTPGTPDAPNAIIGQSTLLNVTSQAISTSVPVTFDPASFTIYQFSANLATPFTLSTSSEYFLGISDTTNPNAEFTLDLTDANSPPGPAANGWTLNADPEVPVGDPSESDGAVSFAFSLSADTVSVPEPATWAMSLGGLGLLAFWRYRARRA
jgi:PEP-CTERM motif